MAGSPIGKKLVSLSDATHSCLIDALSGLWAAAYPSRLVLGCLTSNDNGQQVFDAQSIIFPPSSLLPLVRCLTQAHQCFENGNENSQFEILLNKKGYFHLLATFQYYQESPVFQIRYQWWHQDDKSYANKVAKGLAPAIVSDEPFIYLKHGFSLTEYNVQDLLANMKDLLMETLMGEKGKNMYINFLKDLTEDFEEDQLEERLEWVHRLLQDPSDMMSMLDHYIEKEEHKWRMGGQGNKSVIKQAVLERSPVFLSHLAIWSHLNTPQHLSQ